MEWYSWGVPPTYFVTDVMIPVERTENEVTEIPLCAKNKKLLCKLSIQLQKNISFEISVP